MVFTPNYILLPPLLGSSVKAHSPSLVRSVTHLLYLEHPHTSCLAHSRTRSLISLFINAGPLYLRQIDFPAHLFACHHFKTWSSHSPLLKENIYSAIIHCEFDVIVAVDYMPISTNNIAKMFFSGQMKRFIVYAKLELEGSPKYNSKKTIIYFAWIAKCF